MLIADSLKYCNLEKEIFTKATGCTAVFNPF